MAFRLHRFARVVNGEPNRQAVADNLRRHALAENEDVAIYATTLAHRIEDRLQSILYTDGSHWGFTSSMNWHRLYEIATDAWYESHNWLLACLKPDIDLNAEFIINMCHAEALPRRTTSKKPEHELVGGCLKIEPVPMIRSKDVLWFSLSTFSGNMPDQGQTCSHCGHIRYERIDCPGYTFICFVTGRNSEIVQADWLIYRALPRESLLGCG